MCTICSYNMVKDIDRALLAGVTPAALSKHDFDNTKMTPWGCFDNTKLTPPENRFW
jgi:hypothetical protein